MRQLPCTLDDSNDVRIQRRRKHASTSSTSQRRNLNEPTGTSVGASEVAYGDAALNTEPRPVIEEEGSRDGPPSTQTQHSQGYSTASNGQEPMAEDLLPSSLLDLDFESIAYLDQMFMQDPIGSEWIGQPNSPVLTTERGLELGHEPGPIMGPIDLDHEIVEGAINVDSQTMNLALHAYFENAAPCLPIIIEDAFWQDLSTQQCSVALLCAVACRGVPFTLSENKWEVQQRLALHFREAFLQAQSTAAGDGSNRLDDLEAFALMLHFEYKKDETRPPLASYLGDLVLTHDSLVLMTLRFGAETRTGSISETSGKLSRAAERRSLLFWHVYGLDAFHHLDFPGASRIQDDDVDLTQHLIQPKDKGYLASILALAIIARRITQTLCTSAARHRGVNYDQVKALYEQLHGWCGSVSLPGSQSYPGTNVESLLPRDGASSTSRLSRVPQLHHAVFTVLGLNCFMQMENCVARSALEGLGTLQGEMLVLQVEYETLQAANKLAEASRWMGRAECWQPSEGDSSRSLVDLAPHMLRNILAGACWWIMDRGKQLLRPGSRSVVQDTLRHWRTQLGEEGDRGNIKEQQATNYAAAASMLRDAVATAKSHEDTEVLVAKLSKELDALNQIIKDEF